MNRMFIREMEPEDLSFETHEKRKIGVTGMSRGAGVSLIATSLAKILSLEKDSKVTYAELRSAEKVKTPLMFDALGMDKRFAGRNFIRFYQEIKKGRGIRGRHNLDEGINWVLVAPEDEQENIRLSTLENARLLNNIAGSVIVFDIGDCQGKSECLMDMDALIFVMDPMPSAMLAGFPAFQEVRQLEYRGKPVVWVINKMNAGINKRELKAFLKVKDPVWMPYLSPEKLYSAEYNCKIAYGFREVREQLREPMEKIRATIHAQL